MFICAFIAWVRDPSIIFTFILKGAMRSSGQISICAQLVPSMWCPIGHTSIYEPWDWLVWAIDLSQPTMVEGRLDQMSSHVVWHSGSFLWHFGKVFGDGYHWLLSPCCYTTSMWVVPICYRQNLSLGCAKTSRWSASLSWKDLPSPFWSRVII